ncbi:hypothetical protein FT663_05410 [Candidozyma haemuli var. vulneris]|uniref:Uncharacterized protein n=1 Tax=Candidozyma haemuli TaxID=45357 RepID=A0A2V1B125_9ASCO|nr:hypothetical protein CXQ85_003796 [[Candida] haemuloni]KAF3985164.1 hypothetical protein FT663_05410 [[Candida] haemuloni var. vulneris]KAF3985433.1 hypothetical protein FT662_05154 [[Candida] haemuloni var. vulneris]PVH23506.1 hypothetical protein CXQ85_003796 [[Candida] haemuloni]
MKIVVFLISEALFERSTKVPYMDTPDKCYIVNRADLRQTLQKSDKGVFIVKENNPMRRDREAIHEATKGIDCTVGAYIQQRRHFENLIETKAGLDDSGFVDVTESSDRIEFQPFDLSFEIDRQYKVFKIYESTLFKYNQFWSETNFKNMLQILQASELLNGKGGPGHTCSH